MATRASYTPPQSIFDLEFFHTLQQICFRDRVLIKCGDTKLMLTLSDGARDSLLHVLSFSNTALSLTPKGAEILSKASEVLLSPGAYSVTEIPGDASSTVDGLPTSTKAADDTSSKSEAVTRIQVPQSPRMKPTVTTQHNLDSETKTSPKEPAKETFTCATSKEPFASAQDLRSFMKSPLHVFNLKRLNAGQDIVSEAEFELAQDNPEFMEMLQVRSLARQSSEYDAATHKDDSDNENLKDKKGKKAKNNGKRTKSAKATTRVKTKGKYEYSDEEGEDDNEEEEKEQSAISQKRVNFKEQKDKKRGKKVNFRGPSYEDSDDDSDNTDDIKSENDIKRGPEEYHDEEEDDSDETDSTYSFSEAESVLDDDEGFDSTDEERPKSRSRSRSSSRARETDGAQEDSTSKALFTSPVVTIECPALEEVKAQEFKCHLLKLFLGVETVDEARSLAGVQEQDAQKPEEASESPNPPNRRRRSKLTPDEKRAFKTLQTLDSLPDLTGKFSATVYRPLLLEPRSPIPNSQIGGYQLLLQLASLPMLQPSLHFSVPRQRWAIFLSMGGKFSGGIFDGKKSICHRTFQNYTTRRKQGGSQSAFDSKNGRAKSVGATIRRQQVVRFRERIHECLFDWRAELAFCHRIFLFAPGENKSAFFVTAEEQERWISTGGSKVIRQMELLKEKSPLVHSTDISSNAGFNQDLVAPDQINARSIPLLAQIRDHLVNAAPEKFAPLTPEEVWEEIQSLQFSKHANLALHPLWNQANLNAQYLYLLRRDDPRLRGVPFSIRKITYEEVVRVHSEMTGCVIEKAAPHFDAELQAAEFCANGSEGARQDAKFGRSRNLARFLKQDSEAPKSAEEFYEGWIRPIMCAALKSRKKKKQLELLETISEWYAHILDVYESTNNVESIDHVGMVKEFLEKHPILLTPPLNIPLSRLPYPVNAEASSYRELHDPSTLPLFAAASVMLGKVEDNARKLLAISHVKAIERAKLQKKPRIEVESKEEPDSLRPGDITSPAHVGQILSRSNPRDGSKLVSYARLNDAFAMAENLKEIRQSLFNTNSEEPSVTMSREKSDKPEEIGESEPVDLAAEWNYLIYVLTSRFPEDLNACLSPTYANRTLLHWLCNEEATEEVLYPLLDAGADPTIIDDHGNVPADLAADDGECLRALEFYASQHPNAYDWYDECGIEPFDEQAELERMRRMQEAIKKQHETRQASAEKRAEITKEKEKRREEEALKIKREQAERKEELLRQQKRNAELKEAEKIRLQKLYGMTEKEKRKEEAQRKAAAFRELAGLGKARKCDMCSEPLLKMPFERLAYQYCSTKCLRDHRDELGE